MDKSTKSKIDWQAIQAEVNRRTGAKHSLHYIRSVYRIW